MNKMENKYVVFCDTENNEVDLEYAEKLIQTFREQTGWKVEEGTRIYNELIDFSKGYSKTKRNTDEVCMIFRIAMGLTSM